MPNRIVQGIVLCGIVCLITSISFAQDEKEFLNKIISQAGVDTDYAITFTLKSPDVKSKEERAENSYLEGLSKDDIKLGVAIYKSMLLCGVFKAFAIDSQGAIFLMIRYARWQYKQDNETCEFIEYLAKMINTKYACMDSWRKYYRAFLE